MAVWDRIAAAVTHPRSWATALLVAAGGGVFIALVGTDPGAGKPPLQLPPSSESARAADSLSSFPGGDQVPAIVAVSLGDGSVLTPGEVGAADSARQRGLQSVDETVTHVLVIHQRRTGPRGHRDYFSRSFNALRNARNVSRIKSACVDTSSSTQSEPRPLAASCSSLSTPSNIFSYASSQTRPFSLLNPSTRSLVFLIRSAAASTSGVKFGVSGVTFGVAGVFAGALLAAGVFARAFLAGCLRRGALGWCLRRGASWLVSSPRRSWLLCLRRGALGWCLRRGLLGCWCLRQGLLGCVFAAALWLVSSPRPSWLVSSPRPSCLVSQPFASPWLVSVVGTTLEGTCGSGFVSHSPTRSACGVTRITS